MRLTAGWDGLVQDALHAARGLRRSPGYALTAIAILALVFRQAMAPLAVGLLAGLAAALAVNGLLASLLVEVSPADPVTLVGTCCVLIVAALLGCWIPARRALRVDPLVALRQD